MTDHHVPEVSLHSLDRCPVSEGIGSDDGNASVSSHFSNQQQLSVRGKYGTPETIAALSISVYRSVFAEIILGPLVDDAMCHVPEQGN